MSDLLLILAMAAITYGSRVVFLAYPGSPPSGAARRFLTGPHSVRIRLRGSLRTPRARGVVSEINSNYVVG